MKTIKQLIIMNFLFARPCVICFRVRILYDCRLLHNIHNNLLIAKMQPKISPGLPQHVDRQDDPESVEEDQVDPEIQEVVRRQVLTSCQPFWTKCHPSCVMKNETHRKKSCFRGFPPGQTQTRLHSQRKWSKA